MMLSLFKDSIDPVTKEFAILRARELLISYLNKGIIPNWDDFFQELPPLTEGSDLQEIKEKFIKLTKWPFLEKILDQNATEYFFHGPLNSQALNINGKKDLIEVPIPEEDWQLWLEIISVHFKQNWNVQQPFSSFYGTLFNKVFRITLIHHSTSPIGQSKVVFRSLAQTPLSMELFGETKILQELVKDKKNILIAGATGSGKTSILTSLLGLVGPQEHLIILEDTYEILTHHSYQTRFLSGSTEETSLKNYLSCSLRLSPDRIILGEMRSHEVIPFLMAMNTGHKGLMGTIHASSAIDALNRIALLFCLYSEESNLNYDKVMELITRNLEYVVYMEGKKVKEIIKVLGSEKGVAFFETIVGPKEGHSEINLF